MTEFLTSKAFSVALTLGVFFLAETIYHRWKHPLLNPVLLSILTLMGFLRVSGVSYDDYFEGGQLISFFLGPAVVALGVPLYLHLETIKKHGRAIILAVLTGSITGIISAAGIAAVLGVSRHTIISLAPKSVTTPIAMGITDLLGGIPALTAALVIATGILGAVLGPGLLQVLHVTSPTAVGLAIGTASHGIGTARAFESGETQGAFSSLALCLNGVFTAVLTPLLLALFF
ncbi:CidB/LrgB family autolysis modulator [candidate division KSB3 bacterium]|uniref:CidB/LrgB family autolysis modulator n=1 Tax=candidate division KSB3 bacterium TaxID=2044937 RepID=A0A9D5Q722_9BACT|nr:CidB/LrgB family autolysis modulator [candidate division KSB3 bacterium]MBD3325978.1 CidB/LrgB family autolysis modulator [candidate division KSB3 bacterium]